MKVNKKTASRKEAVFSFLVLKNYCTFSFIVFMAPLTVSCTIYKP